MGYSARYHAASLAAVFLALAVGLLIGAEFGDELINDTARNLEQGLKGDLEEADARIADLEDDLSRQLRFADAVYPALAAETLPGRSLALVALGNRPEDLREDIVEALQPTGAEISQLAVVREPPDLEALEGLLPATTRSPRSASKRQDLAARRAGASLVEGGAFYDHAREALLSSFSGQADALDGVILVRDQPAAAQDGDDAEETDAFEESLIDGMVSVGIPVVGVERTDADPSSIAFFDGQGLTTVDDVDLVAGSVALVYALRGAQGNFGVGEGADDLLPGLLRRAGSTTAP
jgi:hypothetical protein